MNGLREEIGMQFSLTGRIARCRIMWTYHLVWMEDGQLSKKTEAMKEPGCRERVRSQLRWENCVRRNVRKAEGDDKLREKAADRETWKGITAGAVQYMN